MPVNTSYSHVKYIKRINLQYISTLTLSHLQYSIDGQ